METIAITTANIDDGKAPAAQLNNFREVPFDYAYRISLWRCGPRQERDFTRVVAIGMWGADEWETRGLGSVHGVDLPFTQRGHREDCRHLKRRLLRMRWRGLAAATVKCGRSRLTVIATTSNVYVNILAAA